MDFKSAAAKRALLEVYKFRCEYCHGPAEVVDHIIPSSRGGSDALENLTAACNRCNQKKKANLIADEFAAILLARAAVKAEKIRDRLRPRGGASRAVRAYRSRRGRSQHWPFHRLSFPAPMAMYIQPEGFITRWAFSLLWKDKPIGTSEQIVIGRDEMNCIADICDSIGIPQIGAKFRNRLPEFWFEVCHIKTPSRFVKPFGAQTGFSDEEKICIQAEICEVDKVLSTIPFSTLRSIFKEYSEQNEYNGHYHQIILHKKLRGELKRLTQALYRVSKL